MIVGFDVCQDNQNKTKYGALIASIMTPTLLTSAVQAHESGLELSSYFTMSIIARMYVILLFILKLKI